MPHGVNLEVDSVFLPQKFEHRFYEHMLSGGNVVTCCGDTWVLTTVINSIWKNGSGGYNKTSSFCLFHPVSIVPQWAT